MEIIIAFLPKHIIWDVERRARGIDLGNGRFQFDFDHEEDLLRVLKSALIISMESWSLDTRNDFPSTIYYVLSLSQKLATAILERQNI